MNWSVFISYSTKDGKIAQELCSYLENNGKKCFIAPRDIQYGHEYAGEIVNGIDNSKVMVLMLSNYSNQSPHVLREVERAVSKSIPIIIYKMEDVELSKSMEYFLMTHQWMDSKNTEDFANILKCVNDIMHPVSEGTDENSTKGTKEDENCSLKVKNNRKKIITAAVLLTSVVVVGISCLFISNKGKAHTENDSSEEKGVLSKNEDLGEKDISGENETQKKNETPVTIKVTDTVKFGTYNGEKIEWRVLRMSEDGKEAVLISKNILCMKAYDAAESGRYGYDKENNDYPEGSEADTNLQLQMQVRGNSDWSLSNIRTWLNSSKEVVKYEGQAPAISAMIEKKNGYDHEPGFLYGFDEKEIEAIKEVEHSTSGNAVSGKASIQTKDKVYLLSLEEVKWFEDAGMSVLAEPTQAAIDNDGTTWYKDDMEIFSVTAHYWWLREPVKEASSRCYIVGNGNREQLIYDRNVGLEGYGIRPAITVYVDKLAELQND